jgi:quercetin dioxygenase-like cupin family protein
MHHVQRAAEVELVVPERYESHARGFSQAALVGRDAGAVHTGFALNRLAGGGHIDVHLHSVEESFYVLAGHPLLSLEGRVHRLAPGDCGLIGVGGPHAWGVGDGDDAEWLEVMSPPPRLAGPPDTFFTGEAMPIDTGAPVDIRDPRNRGFFRLDPGAMELDNLKLGAPVDAPTVSASMATALLAYSGIAVKMLVDQRLGAVLHTMFMVEYEPGGVAQSHDHPLEEAYYVLDGEVEADADDDRFTLRAGDFLWTAAGCIHAFHNRSPRRVRWLETQSPQPPSNYAYRFNRDWDYLAERLPAARGRDLRRAR